jgi:hypothetical protein
MHTGRALGWPTPWQQAKRSTTGRLKEADGAAALTKVAAGSAVQLARAVTRLQFAAESNHHQG